MKCGFTSISSARNGNFNGKMQIHEKCEKKDIKRHLTCLMSIVWNIRPLVVYKCAPNSAQKTCWRRWTCGIRWSEFRVSSNEFSKFLICSSELRVSTFRGGGVSCELQVQVINLKLGRASKNSKLENRSIYVETVTI